VGAGGWALEGLTAWLGDGLNEILVKGELVEQAGGMSASDWVEVSQVHGSLAQPPEAPLGPKLCAFVKRQEGFFMAHVQKSCSGRKGT